MNAVMAMTDIDGDGQVSWQEFVPTAYDILVDVARGMRVRKGSAARSTPAATPLRACVRARARQLPCIPPASSVPMKRTESDGAVALAAAMAAAENTTTGQNDAAAEGKQSVRRGDCPRRAAGLDSKCEECSIEEKCGVDAEFGVVNHRGQVYDSRQRGGDKAAERTERLCG